MQGQRLDSRFPAFARGYGRAQRGNDNGASKTRQDHHFPFADFQDAAGDGDGLGTGNSLKDNVTFYKFSDERNVFGENLKTAGHGGNGNGPDSAGEDFFIESENG